LLPCYVKLIPTSGILPMTSRACPLGDRKQQHISLLPSYRLAAASCLATTAFTSENFVCLMSVLTVLQWAAVLSQLNVSFGKEQRKR
jgi:hypothetical protein